MYKINFSPNDDATLLEVKGSTVNFLRYIVNDIEYISFDTSDRGAPEPMQNALLGLRLITNSKTRLIMINHRRPEGLLAKLDGKFDYIEKTTDSGDVVIEFFLSNNKTITDLNNIDNNCNG